MGDPEAPTTAEGLRRLDAWLSRQPDRDQYEVKLETFSAGQRAGWALSVSLDDTGLQGRPLEVLMDFDGYDFLVSTRDLRRYTMACSYGRLAEGLGHFLDWADRDA